MNCRPMNCPVSRLALDATSLGARSRVGDLHLSATVVASASPMSVSPPIRRASPTRTIDHFRHAERQKPSDELTEEGLLLAQRVGRGEFGALPSYDRVLSSTADRALFTAQAMGYSVDQRLCELDPMPIGLIRQLEWPQPLGRVAERFLGSGPAGSFSRAQATLLSRIAADLAEGGSALVVSHGGNPEAAAIASCPSDDFHGWGEPLRYLEGIRYSFGEGRCVQLQFLRLPPTHYR